MSKLRIRKALIMKLQKDNQEEYELRHNLLWPEMKELLKKHKIHNYSIHLDKETDLLFAYMEIEDEMLHEKLSEDPVCKKWWDYMSTIMYVNHDNSPVVKNLKEVFYLE